MAEISCLEAWHVADEWAFAAGGFDPAGRRGGAGYHWWIVVATSGGPEPTHLQAVVKRTGNGWRGHLRGSRAAVRRRAVPIDRTPDGRTVWLPFVDHPLPPIPIDEFLAAPARRDPKKDVPAARCTEVRDAILASPPASWGAVQRAWRPVPGRRCPGCAACEAALEEGP